MIVDFYGESKEVYEVCKKGGRHEYYTIFDKEPVGVLNDDSQELRTVEPENDDFVKEIRIDFDRYSAKAVTYSIRDREAGNKIDDFSSLDEAKEALLEYEKEDKKDGNYQKDFYEIIRNPLCEL